MRIEQGVQEMERGGKVLWVVPLQHRAGRFMREAIGTCTAEDIEVSELYCKIKHKSGGFIQFLSQERALIVAQGVEWSLTNSEHPHLQAMVRK